MLLVLLVVGSVDRRLIERHKRLRDFTIEDYDRLRSLLDKFSGIVTTPNVLTEVSNLAVHQDSASTEVKARLRLGLAALAGKLNERYLPSRAVVALEEFRFLGLTDSANLLVEGVTILTCDAVLYLASLKKGLAAINFNHLRGGWI